MENQSRAKQIFAEGLKSHMQVVQQTENALHDIFIEWALLCQQAIDDGNKIIFFGNGGSDGDSQHLATELTVRYAKNRKPLPAIALTTDSSALTAIGNDFGFEYLFARQIEAIGQKGDIACAISTSGQSPNIIKGLESAAKLGIHCTGLAGKDGGKMVGLAKPLLIVPSDNTARIQEMHIMLGQLLCQFLEDIAAERS